MTRILFDRQIKDNQSPAWISLSFPFQLLFLTWEQKALREFYPAAEEKDWSRIKKFTHKQLTFKGLSSWFLNFEQYDLS